MKHPLVNSKHILTDPENETGLSFYILIDLRFKDLCKPFPVFLEHMHSN